MGETIIIDDFIGGFEAYRDILDSHIFSGVQSPVDGVFYKGVSADIPQHIADNIKANLDLYYENVEIKYQFVRISQEGIFAPHGAHNDASMSTHSCRLYLNRTEDCAGGTSFVSHVDEGMPYGPENDEQLKAWQLDSSNENKWNIDEIATMKPNRAVMFESDRMHRSEPVGGFGRTTKDARLVLVTFFDADT